MKTFKTAKGTELPIMDIKGKDYLQAAPRIVWFREERPDWGIETEFLSLSDSHAVCRATIRNDNGRIIAQATSMETKSGFESFVEKAETCAVSRAASFCNFGTLMAQELEEQGRLDERDTSGAAKLAEAPAAPRSAVAPTQSLDTNAESDICSSCSGRMMVSKYANKTTGAFDFYCAKCKKSVPRTT